MNLASSRPSSRTGPVGDKLTTGDGRRFRILGIVGLLDDVGIYNALWKVESAPTDGLR